MDLWRIALRSIMQRRVASLLTTISMSLGVMMVVSVLSIHGLVSQSFRNNSALGYNMIVGAKGGSLQLVLNTVFYLSKPVENISYEYYLEFQDQETRAREYQHSLKYMAAQAESDMLEMQAFSGLLGGAGDLGGLLALDAIEQTEKAASPWETKGQYTDYAHFIIPLCLGDYFGNFRVIGTTPAMLGDRVYDMEEGKKYEFSAGRNLQIWSKENGYFEAVLGANVAREKKMKVGDRFSPTHGDPEGKGHGEQFVVVGILAPSGTPNDRGVFISLEGFLLMEGHSKPLEGKATRTVADADLSLPLPLEQREITAALLRTDPIVAPGMHTMINEGRDAQIALPVQEIYSLFDIIVNPIRWILIVLTGMICVVSGVSILVSIYNSMSERGHEIAIMRALGAGRGTVMWIVLLEAVFLAMAGGVVGWLAAHSLTAIASPFIEERTGVTIGFFDLTPPVNLPEILGLVSASGDGRLGAALLGSFLAIFGVAALVMGVIYLVRAVLRRDREAGLSAAAMLLLGGLLIAAGGVFYWTTGNISSELLLIPALLLLAVLVGLLPGWAAYRTDVVKALGK
ncbi:ABC transporter permease [Lignipirellula cremea]|uniref:FtsX-like permease family protein n=1 Tax=Lignipirellula cremea TaxID=2528010 RepID=A0A518E1I2_9BACT|nr:ABC transporter permease [Lignipirellula cremea]QDU97956.1 FtsX-like permease family protein [Lignipirellula cremea]